MQLFNTYGEAAAKLPADAEWTASFGYPGCGGYKEYFRTPDGTEYKISNGNYDDVFRKWSCEH